MTPAGEEETIDPLKNLERLFLLSVDLLLVNIRIIVVILSLFFLTVMLLLAGFFNFLGI